MGLIVLIILLTQNKQEGDTALPVELENNPALLFVIIQMSLEVVLDLNGQFKENLRSTNRAIAGMLNYSTDIP